MKQTCRHPALFFCQGEQRKSCIPPIPGSICWSSLGMDAAAFIVVLHLRSLSLCVSRVLVLHDHGDGDANGDDGNCVVCDGLTEGTGSLSTRQPTLEPSRQLSMFA